MMDKLKVESLPRRSYKLAKAKTGLKLKEIRNFFNWMLILVSWTGLCYADIFQSLDISQAGMKVQQQQLQVMAENVANINTAKHSDGTAYRIKEIKIRTNKRTGEPFVLKVQETESNMDRVYDPNNPEADEMGYVYIPRQSLSGQMVKLSEMKRIYEANAAVFSTTKQLAQTIMNLGK